MRLYCNYACRIDSRISLTSVQKTNLFGFRFQFSLLWNLFPPTWRQNEHGRVSQWVKVEECVCVQVNNAVTPRGQSQRILLRCVEFTARIGIIFTASCRKVFSEKFIIFWVNLYAHATHAIIREPFQKSFSINALTVQNLWKNGSVSWLGKNHQEDVYESGSSMNLTLLTFRVT